MHQQKGDRPPPKTEPAEKKSTMNVETTQLEQLLKLERAARLLANEAQTTDGINKEYKLLASWALRRQLKHAADIISELAAKAAQETKDAAAQAAAERRAK